MKDKNESGEKPLSIRYKYIDLNGHLNLPIAKGKVSFIRKVDSYGKIASNYKEEDPV